MKESGTSYEAQEERCSLTTTTTKSYGHGLVWVEELYLLLRTSSGLVSMMCSLLMGKHELDKRKTREKKKTPERVFFQLKSLSEFYGTRWWYTFLVFSKVMECGTDSSEVMFPQLL